MCSWSSTSNGASECSAPFAALCPVRPGSVAFDCSRFESTSKQPLPPLKSAPSSFCRFLDEMPCADRLCARRHARMPLAVAPHATAQETRPNPKGPIGSAPSPLLPLKGCSTTSPSTRLAQDGAQPAALPRVPSLGTAAVAPAALPVSSHHEPSGVGAYLSEHEEVWLACCASKRAAEVGRQSSPCRP